MAQPGRELSALDAARVVHEGRHDTHVYGEVVIEVPGDAIVFTGEDVIALVAYIHEIETKRGWLDRVLAWLQR